MFRQFSSRLGTAALATTVLFFGSSVVVQGHGGGGHGGGGHGGGYAGGAHHAGGYYHGAGYYHGGNFGGYRPYGYGGYHGLGYGYGLYRPYYGSGFYRPYYGYGGYGLGGLGVGGIGLGGYGLGGYGLGGYGMGGYGMGGYGLGGYGLGGYGLGGYGGGYGSSLPYSGGYGMAGAGVVGNSPGSSVNAPPGGPGQTPPPPDNAAHLQLIVPENAEVQFDGSKTTQTGSAREFVSPPLTVGQVFTYKIIVRSADPSGKPINDARDIRVQANDWVRIDFTRPAPPEPLPVAPNPRP